MAINIVGISNGNSATMTVMRAYALEAVNKWGAYIPAVGNINIGIGTEMLNTGVIAAAYSFPTNIGWETNKTDLGRTVVASPAAYAMSTGLHFTGMTNDAVILASLRYSNFAGDDAVSVFAHELGHVLGFNTLGSGYATPLQTMIRDGFFYGTAAVEAYGGKPVPMSTDGAHFAATKLLSYDLMSTSIPPHTVVEISYLDLCVLRDCGAAVIMPVPHFIVSTGTETEKVLGTVIGSNRAFERMTGDSYNVMSLTGNAYIHTGSGNDKLGTVGGNNIFDAGLGNDDITGGSGFDVARFSGSSSSYIVQRLSAGNYVINGLDGTDYLHSIEALQFGNLEPMAIEDLVRSSNVLFQQDVSGSIMNWNIAGASIETAIVGDGATWHIRGTADLNGDGLRDILFQADDGTVATWNMHGAKVIDTAMLGTSPGQVWRVKATGDFNGDGKTDVVFQHEDGTVALWNIADNHVIGAAAVGANPGTSWHVLDTGDFNGDGHADLLYQNDDGTIAIWFMDASAVIGAAVLGSNPGAAWHVEGISDFNGDGRSDILFQHDDGTVAIWNIDKSAVIGASLIGENPGAVWHVMGLNDLNCDGWTDIIFQHDNGAVAEWDLHGSSIIGASLVGINPGVTWHVKPE